MASDLRMLKGLIVSPNARVASLLEKSMKAIGVGRIKSAPDADVACALIDDYVPRFVLIYADIANDAQLKMALTINKKRAPSNRLTPKIPALARPTADQILLAREQGFYDVIPLPTTPSAMRLKLDAVFSRMD